MSIEVNQSIFSGNLARDAETRYTPDGRPVVSFTIANNRTTKQEKKTTWIRCSWFGQQAERVAEYLTKGTAVLVFGAIELREYQDKSGVTRSSLELFVDKLQLLGGRPTGETTEGTEGGLVASVQRGRAEAETFDFDGDPVPF